MSDYVTKDGNAAFIRRLMKWSGTKFSDDAEWAEREILRLRAELAAAIAERDAAIERAEKYQRTAAELSDKLNGTPCAEIRWQYERDALREALKPFARLQKLEWKGTMFENGRDDDAVFYHHATGTSLTLGDFCRARAALDGAEPR